MYSLNVDKFSQWMIQWCEDERLETVSLLVSKGVTWDLEKCYSSVSEVDYERTGTGRGQEIMDRRLDMKVYILRQKFGWDEEKAKEMVLSRRSIDWGI